MKGIKRDKLNRLTFTSGWYTLAYVVVLFILSQGFIYLLVRLLG